MLPVASQPGGQELSHCLECGAHEIPLGGVHLRLVHPLARLPIRVVRRLDLLVQVKTVEPCEDVAHVLRDGGVRAEELRHGPKELVEVIDGLD